MPPWQRQKNLKILMGELQNANIGANSCRYGHVIGKRGLGRMNKNGELFTDFWAISNMVIGGSIFPHKDIPKASWQFPDHVTENETDHMCIGQKFRRTLQGVRVKGGANALLDFHLVMATLKLHLKQCPVQKNPRAWYNMDHLKDRGTADKFRLKLTNRFKALQEQYQDSNTDQYAGVLTVFAHHRFANQSDGGRIIPSSLFARLANQYFGINEQSVTNKSFRNSRLFCWHITL